MSTTPPPFDPNTNPKAAAKAAKAYAKATRPWFKKKRFIIPAALVGLMVIGSALGGGGETEPTADSTPVAETKADANTSEAKAEATKAPAKKKPAKKKVKTVKVDAATLIKEFETNELAGDKKYKGKTIEVTGVVDKIDTEIWDDDKYILRIGTGEQFAFLNVNCNGMSTDELSTLSVGDDVTAIGKFDDGGDLGVELKKCKLK